MSMAVTACSGMLATRVTEGTLIGFLKTNPTWKPTQDPPASYVIPFAGLCALPDDLHLAFPLEKAEEIHTLMD